MKFISVTVYCLLVILSAYSLLPARTPDPAGIMSAASENMRRTGLAKTAMDEASDDLVPGRFSISQNYPNPFNGTTNIKINMPAEKPEGICEFRLYNIIGCLVYYESFTVNKSIVFRFNTDKLNLPSGTYIYKIQTEGRSLMKKMILLK